MRTNKNALGIYSRRAKTRLQLRFARTGDEMRTYCERGERSVNEMVELRTSCERAGTGWTPESNRDYVATLPCAI